MCDAYSIMIYANNETKSIPFIRVVGKTENQLEHETFDWRG